MGPDRSRSRQGATVSRGECHAGKLVERPAGRKRRGAQRSAGAGKDPELRGRVGGRGHERPRQARRPRPPTKSSARASSRASSTLGAAAGAPVASSGRSRTCSSLAIHARASAGKGAAPADGAFASTPMTKPGAPRPRPSVGDGDRRLHRVAGHPDAQKRSARAVNRFAVVADHEQDRGRAPGRARDSTS